MKKSDYSQKLLDPRWQKKRLEILDRDSFTCQLCGDNKNTLHVHHKIYMKDTEVWDYRDELLITLCANCHNGQKDIKAEMEELLLSTLYSKGIMHEDLLELACAFSYYEPFVKPIVFSWSIRLLVSNKDLMIKLLKSHYDEKYLNKKIEEFQNG